VEKVEGRVKVLRDWPGGGWRNSVVCLIEMFI
jgi:hypothetical protein